MYLIGDWHGYCLNLDVESPDRDKLRDFTGRVIVYREVDKDEVFKEHPELPTP